MVWERPKHVPFPNVWHRFTGRIKVNGKPLEYRVQDISDELIEPCIEHMVRHFLIREAFTAHDGFTEDDLSLKEIKQVWRDQLHQRVSLVAIVEGEGDESKRIAGLNMLSVTQRIDQKKQFEGKGMQRLIKVLEELYDRENLFDKYGVDHYLNALGLSVAAHYQGDGVGYNILKARNPLCRAIGLTVAVTSFSNPAAVHEAKKEGYEVIQATTVDKLYLDGEPFYPRLKDRIYVLTAKIIPSSE